MIHIVIAIGGSEQKDEINHRTRGISISSGSARGSTPEVVWKLSARLHSYSTQRPKRALRGVRAKSRWPPCSLDSGTARPTASRTGPNLGLLMKPAPARSVAVDVDKRKCSVAWMLCCLSLCSSP